jgi:hypothetical protein
MGRAGRGRPAESFPGPRPFSSLSLAGLATPEPANSSPSVRHVAHEPRALVRPHRSIRLLYPWWMILSWATGRPRCTASTMCRGAAVCRDRWQPRPAVPERREPSSPAPTMTWCRRGLGLGRLGFGPGRVVLDDQDRAARVQRGPGHRSPCPACLDGPAARPSVEGAARVWLAAGSPSGPSRPAIASALRASRPTRSCPS